MPSDLAVKKVDLEGDIGESLGLGYGPIGDCPEWSARDARRIRRSAQSGLRDFYFCGHVWSFMRQTAAIILPQGETVVRLPDDFGGVDGQSRVLVARTSDDQGQVVLKFEGIGTVNRDLQLNPELTGWPRRIAQRPCKTVPVGQQGRDELVVSPIADTEYRLSFEYLVTPDYVINEAQPYVYGGTEHHQAILALCLAAAEVIQDNRIGPLTAMAQQALQKAIRLDRLKCPQTLGYNRDLSDNLHGNRHWIERQWPNTAGGVLYNGVLYDE